MIYAASPMMSVVLDFLMLSSPPRRFFTAAVAIAVLGHRVLHPIPSSLSSPERPYSNHFKQAYLSDETHAHFRQGVASTCSGEPVDFL